MAEQKNSTKNTAPNLYTYYGKQYIFDDLKKSSDSGFAEYLSTLRRGDKDADYLWNAYNDIMSGIGDGSITFDNGRFNDSLGRYSNGVYYDSEGNKQTSNKKSKDYYGLVANYIAGKLGKSQEYQIPEDKSKIKWKGNNSLGLAFNRKIFNSDSGNIQDFLDLDYDSTNNTFKGTDNRVKYTKEALQDIYDNFDKYFSEYSDQDYTQSRNYLLQAIQSLNDNTLDSQDYLPLSRAVGGINWRNLFMTQSPQEKQGVEQQEDNLTGKFAEWVNQKYPLYSGNLQSRTLNIGKTYNEEAKTGLQNLLNATSDKDLYRMIRSIISDKNYSFYNEPNIYNQFTKYGTYFANQYGLSSILNTLKNKNKLQSFGESNPNLYFIPGTTQKNNTGWVWDTSNNSIKQMSIRDIPYWQQRMINEYKNQNSDNFDWATPYLKNGGIVKAQNGTSLWYSSLQDFDPANYTYEYDTTRLVNGDMSDNNFNAWISNKPGLGTGRYLPSEGNTREYTQGVENQNYYKTFGNALLNNDGNFTNLGTSWAKAVDSYLPSNSPASFFDNDGNLRSSWTVNNKDIYGRAPQVFNNLKDYLHYVRNDQILGARHNVFLNKGKRYFYKDNNNQIHWVDPSVISNYTVSDSPVKSGWNDDKTVYWEDYEVTGPKHTSKSKQNREGNPSYVNPRVEKQKTSSNDFNNFASQLSPELLGISRLFQSLRTNNRITNTIMKSLNPVLKNTYERYSPITGNFGEMQFRNNQAANLRRQASRPFTSDASLQLAGQLDANKQAQDLEYQGYVADNKEIQRTKEAALARQEDNMARRSEVANFNRASINQTNRDRAELSATRLRRNWQSIDNFLQGLESRLRTRLMEDQQRKYSTSAQMAQNQYQNAVQAYNQKYRESNPNATSESMLNDTNYISKINQFKNRYQYDLYNISRGRYLSNPYLNNIPDTYDQILKSRKGDSLRPNTMYLINKIIRNENNT